VGRSAAGTAVGVGETTQVVCLGNYQSQYVEGLESSDDGYLTGDYHCIDSGETLAKKL
jgi:hypothetical protein